MVALVLLFTRFPAEMDHSVVANVDAVVVVRLEIPVGADVVPWTKLVPVNLLWKQSEHHLVS
jgi:hypothetical protein